MFVRGLSGSIRIPGSTGWLIAEVTNSRGVEKRRLYDAKKWLY
jgi:hypothetical protein